MDILRTLTVEDSSLRKKFDRRKKNDNDEFNSSETEVSHSKETEKRKRVERRENPKVLNSFWYILFAWGGLTITITFLTIFSKNFIEIIFPDSSFELFSFIYYLFSVVLFLSLGLGYNQFRNRRKSDKLNYFTITSTSFAFFALIVYLLIFQL